MTATAVAPRLPDWDQQGVVLPYVKALRKSIENPQPVDGDWLDGLLTQLSQQLYAVYRDQDVDRALNGMQRLMAIYDEHEHKCFGAARPPASAAARWSRITRRPLATASQASPQTTRLPLATVTTLNRAAPIPLGNVVPAAHEHRPQPTRPLHNPPSPAARQPTPNPIAPAPYGTPQTQAHVQQQTGRAPEAQGKLHVSKAESLFGTWIVLIIMSWISLGWGTLISLPFGVGFGLAATFLGGVVAVPLWGTVFGFLGMSFAKNNTLNAMGFNEVPSGHSLHATVTRFATDLDMPVPTIGTMPAFNAFAMGMSRRSATIAIGEPLMDNLTHEEIDAIIGHELGHIASGDMRRMMLMRTFQNATVWYMGSQKLKHFARYIVCWMAELFIASSSREREFWADAFGAALAGKGPMISALLKMQAGPSLSSLENTHARFMFRGRLSGMFSTHPSFERRIKALQDETYMRKLRRKR